MDRRDFLKGSMTVAALASMPNIVSAQQNQSENPMSVRAFKGDKKISLLGFGMMRLPMKGQEVDQELVNAMVDKAYKAGVNYYDTAYVYINGKSEVSTGVALRKYPRSSYYVADKLPVGMLKKPEDAERIFNEHLSRLGMDYIDFYLLHTLGDDLWKKAQELKLLDFLVKKRAEGKIRYIGFSFHDNPDVLRKIVPAFNWDFVQIQLNYFDWYNYKSGEQYEILTKANIPVTIMEPLRGGALANIPEEAVKLLKAKNPTASPAEWAFRYVASLPNVLTVLSGMNRLDHLEENLRTFSPAKPLADDERKVLDEATVAIRKSLTVPCTACQYCMPCPVGVQIPRIFALYNQVKANPNLWWYYKQGLAELTEDERPSACIACGKCMKKCPQHIKIPVLMKQIAAELKL